MCQWAPPPSQHRAEVKFKEPLTVSHFQPGNSLIGIDAADITYLDVFRHRLIDGIVGSSARPAWKALIMQMLHQEPAFRHAVVAFGAVNGLINGEETRFQSDATSLPVPAPDKTLALRHYNSCLQGVQELVARGDEYRVNGVLLCALMCICFELRIGMPAIALRHLEHGLSIIASNATVVNDDLFLAFAKLDIQASMFLGHRIPKTDTTRLDKIAVGRFKGYPAADKAMTCLLGKIFQFLRSETDAYRFCQQDTIPTELYTQAQALQAELAVFQTLYLPLGISNVTTASRLPHQGQVLWIMCLILNIILSSCLCLDEMIYDLFLTDFETVTTLSENMMTETRSSIHGYKEFRLNMALLYPLFKTALMCRSPPIRRRILALMAKVSFDEGVWDGSSGQMYTEAVMRLEEQGLGLDGVDVTYLGPEAVPEQNRIRTLDIQPETSERYSTCFVRFNTQTRQWDDLVESVIW